MDRKLALVTMLVIFTFGVLAAEIKVYETTDLKGFNKYDRIGMIENSLTKMTKDINTEFKDLREEITRLKAEIETLKASPKK